MGHADNEELRDQTIAELARKHAAAIKTNILVGHQQTLKDLGNALGDRLAQSGVSEQLMRSAISCGPNTAGQVLIDLIQKCIDYDAEYEALLEIERMEAAAKADPDNIRPTPRQLRQLDAMQA